MNFEMMVVIITNKEMNAPYTKVYFDIDTLVDSILGFCRLKNRSIIKDSILRSSFFETDNFTFKVDYHHLSVGVIR